ncbi:MAG: amidohydrolase family protein [Xanthomonadales bacterium]|nr:amidohydrolase family protein [Xanthomonadales bacterium]
MTSRLPYPVYDADHHFYESAESITKYLPKKYKKTIQYVQVNGRTKLAVGGLISDYIPDPTFNNVAPPGSMIDWFLGNNPDGLTQREFFGTPIHPPEAWRTVEDRLKEIEEQGLDGTLMFPTLASAVEERLGNYDVEAMCAIMHSLNQWMLENWGFNRDDKIFTAPVISLADVDWAVNELNWALENGARTVLIRPAPVPNVAGSRSPGFKEFDPFWERVNESKIFVTMHASDSGYDKFVRMWVGGSEYLPFQPDAFSFALKPAARAISDTMTAMICHGVFDRFPEVRIAAMENGAAWVGDCLDNLKKVYKMFPQEFECDPVAQFKKHIYVAPFFEDSLEDLKDLIGADRVLFGSDYPHPEGVADPLEFLETLGAYSEEEQRMVMGGNLKALLERPLA